MDICLWLGCSQVTDWQTMACLLYTVQAGAHWKSILVRSGVFAADLPNDPTDPVRACLVYTFAVVILHTLSLRIKVGNVIYMHWSRLYAPEQINPMRHDLHLLHLSQLPTRRLTALIFWNVTYCIFAGRLRRGWRCRCSAAHHGTRARGLNVISVYCDLRECAAVNLFQDVPSSTISFGSTSQCWSEVL